MSWALVVPVISNIFWYPIQANLKMTGWIDFNGDQVEFENVQDCKIETGVDLFLNGGLELFRKTLKTRQELSLPVVDVCHGLKV